MRETGTTCPLTHSPISTELRRVVAREFSVTCRTYRSFIMSEVRVTLERIRWEIFFRGNMESRHQKKSEVITTPCRN